MQIQEEKIRIRAEGRSIRQNSLTTARLSSLILAKLSLHKEDRHLALLHKIIRKRVMRSIELITNFYILSYQYPTHMAESSEARLARLNAALLDDNKRLKGMAKVAEDTLNTQNNIGDELGRQRGVI